MSTNSFCSNCGTKLSKYYTSSEAVGCAMSNDTTDIVLLPPNIGNQQVDSDMEDWPDNSEEN